MRVLVTGAAGFLGSHLAAHYLDKGDAVYGVDNFISSKPRSKHFSDLKKNGLCFTECDVSNRGWFRGYLINGNFDLILNFACPASPPVYQKFPIETMMTSIDAVKTLLHYAIDRPYVKIVHASTSEVYGNPLSSPQREVDAGQVHSWGPRSCYDSGKMAAEALCFDYLNQEKVDVRLVRIFNTYGPHMLMDDGRVVTNLVKQALRNEDLTVYGDGLQTRSFCYVDDLIAGITSLAVLDKNPGHPINVGNPGEFTMMELALKILELIPDSKSKIDFAPLPQHDPMQRKPDITKARELLKWEPKVDLDEGLRRFIAYARTVI